jgi:hypothetical protein
VLLLPQTAVKLLFGAVIVATTDHFPSPAE